MTEDISCGVEPFDLPVVNDVDDTFLDPFVYSNEVRFLVDRIEETGIECKDCVCPQGYNECGFVECGPACPCPTDRVECRRTQQGLSWRLEVVYS
ncbi:unnamed protein product, partial [Mesorhabditis spiculigera]